MIPTNSRLRSNPTTLAFVGPHRVLVTAKSALALAFDAGSVQELPPDPWATVSFVPTVEAPLATQLSERDSSIFEDALQVEAPNEALRQAMARRVVLRG